MFVPFLFLFRVITFFSLSFFQVTKNNKYIVLGGENGAVSIRRILTLDIIHSLDLSSHGAVRCIQFTPDDQYFIIGSNDGTFSICTSPDLKLKMLRYALQTTPMF